MAPIAYNVPSQCDFWALLGSPILAVADTGLHDSRTLFITIDGCSA